MHRYPDGTERPVEYASRSLLPSEERYAQLEKEALAIVFAVKKFHMYLYAREFTLVTDHRPLVKIFGPKDAVPTLAAARLQRWAIVLSAYNYCIEWRASADNATADMLSRLPLKATPRDVAVEGANDAMVHLVEGLPVTAKQIQKATELDRVLNRVLQFSQTGWPEHGISAELTPFWHRRHELTIEQGCEIGRAHV